jgi:DNA-binding transcriptional LysR family regulator
MLLYVYIHGVNEKTTADLQNLALNLLRIFDAVMSEGGITRAAERLQMTQPAVSNAMRRLTQALGERLLTRESRGVRATAFAERLWPQVRDALAQLTRALQPDAFDPATDSGLFVIGMADATAAVLMPPLAQALEAARSRSAVRCVPLLSREPRRPLERDEIDLAIGHFPEAAALQAAEGDLAPLRQMRLLAGDYQCVMRRGHPLATAELTLDAFCSARHVQVSFSGRGHGAVDQALASLGRSRTLAMTVNQYLTAARIVSGTDMLTVLPRGIVPGTGLGETLVERPLPLAAGGLIVDAWWHLRHETAPRHRWLREQVRLAALAAAAESAQADNGPPPPAAPGP